MVLHGNMAMIHATGSRGVMGDWMTASLAEIVRRARKAKRLTQKQLGARIGKEQSYISDVERGHLKTPAQAILQDFSRELGVPLRELYEAVGWYADADSRLSVDNVSFARIAEPTESQSDPDLDIWLDAKRLSPDEYAALLTLAKRIVRGAGDADR